jgi:hypothetical protein
VRNAEQVKAMVHNGLTWAAAAGRDSYWLHVTDRTPAGLHLTEFQRAWKSLGKFARRAELSWEHYFSVLGVGDHGRLHRHVAAIMPQSAPEITSENLSEISARCGLGWVRVQPVSYSKASIERVSAYMALNSWEYAKFHWHGGGRISPWSTSKRR